MIVRTIRPALLAAPVVAQQAAPPRAEPVKPAGAAAVKALTCDAVAADERRLRRRYRSDPAVLRALDRARDPDG
ncbi:hypothetical protein [Methylobacterium brachiatum]